MSRYAMQAKVAESKRAHPEQFCSHPGCLWRTGGGNCPRHPRTIPILGATEPYKAPDGQESREKGVEVDRVEWRGSTREPEGTASAEGLIPRIPRRAPVLI
jgi:hypothetical protein